MSIDVSIEESMSASFFDLFSAKVGISVKTGYNWGHTSEASKSKQVTVEVKTSVKPKYTLQILQATGFCGDSQVNTEKFKIVHKKGEEVMFEEYEWTFVNATSLKIF